MPVPSRRLTGISPDTTDAWAVFYRARALRAAGVAVADLTIGEHDTPTDPSILDAMAASAAGGHTGYASVPGIAALRDALAARMAAEQDCAITRDNILVTPGAQAALFAAHHAALNPGDRALIIDPYYATYPGVIRALDAEPVAVAAGAEAGFQPGAADLHAAAARSGARSLLINSPNNPTGTVYTPETLRGIAEVAEAHDLWVIADEVYSTQVWSGRHTPLAALPGMAGRTLTLGSFSKSHAMTGSRLGWICAPAEIIADLIELATHVTYGVPGFIQDAGLFALNAGAALEAAVAAPFRRRRDRVLAQLARQTLVRAVPPDGAMYVMLDIRATGLSGQDFAERLLDTHQIAVMPGESFGAAAAGHVRVALTLPDDALDAALATLLTFAADRTGEGARTPP